MRKKPSSGYGLFVQQPIAINHRVIGISEQCDQKLVGSLGFDLGDDVAEFFERVRSDRDDVGVRLQVGGQ